jgi:hypothetical protein
LHTKALDLHGGFNNLSRPKAVWTNKAVLYLLTRKGGLGEQSRFIFIHAQRRFGRIKPFYIYSRAKVVWANKAALSNGVFAASLSICTYNKNGETHNLVLTCEINCVIYFE